jgi:hypothetical protein
MSDRVFSVQERHLSPAAVAQLVSALRGAQGSAPVVLDLRAVETVAPEAMAALIELGRSQSGVRELSLAGLSRAFTLAAVQAGLAERFSIRAQALSPSRRALIFELPGAVGAGALDIAGQPLLIRQLQWLRDQGIEDVVVEVTVGHAAAERAGWLLGTDPLTLRCQVIPSRSALGALGLAEHAGLASDELFLALPADSLICGPWQAPEVARVVRYPAPAFAPQAPTPLLEVRSRNQVAPSDETPATEGWALAIRDLGAAHALSCAVLAGEVGDVLVHAAELRPGIWLARGARVAEDAMLVAPVLVGPRARVLAKAQLGPNVIIGADAVIERDAVLVEVGVRADTLVGEGAHIRNARVDARGITSFAESARTDVDDPLQLASAIDRASPLTVRWLALCGVLALGIPWLLAFSITVVRGRRVVRQLPWRGRSLHLGTIGLAMLDLVPALVDVLRGRRDLLGVAQPRALEVEGARSDGPARAGALDVSGALAPGASMSTLLWMWRWYLLNKGFALDRRLFWSALRDLVQKPRNAG